MLIGVNLTSPKGLPVIQKLLSHGVVDFCEILMHASWGHILYCDISSSTPKSTERLALHLTFQLKLPLHDLRDFKRATNFQKRAFLCNG
jgi:hypothetical protein